ncbi:MAG: hypothetical protein ACD_56C00153G0003 [uncultured bacterium]|nr:MAG: hypothetical protein ACD_56C00153G0003 [uncultured bacterium]
MRVRLTAEFRNLLSNLEKAMTLPTTSTIEHEYMSSGISYFRNLEGKPYFNDRVFKREVNGMWMAMENCAHHCGKEETAQVFWSLQAEFKRLHLTKSLYTAQEVTGSSLKNLRRQQRVQSYDYI